MSKTITQLLPMQFVNVSSVVTSSIVDVTSVMAATVHLGFCQTNNTNHLTNAPTFRIEGQYEDTPRFWFPLASWEPKTEAPGSTQILNTAAVGSSVLEVSDIPYLWMPGQLCFILHIIDASPSNLSKCEFVRILRTETGTPPKVYLQYPTTLNHSDTLAETAYVYNNAERWVGQLSLAAVRKIRVLVDASTCDKEFVTEAYLTSLDPS